VDLGPRAGLYGGDAETQQQVRPALLARAPVRCRPPGTDNTLESLFDVLDNITQQDIIRTFSAPEGQYIECLVAPLRPATDAFPSTLHSPYTPIGQSEGSLLRSLWETGRRIWGTIPGASSASSRAAMEVEDDYGDVADDRGRKGKDFRLVRCTTR